MLSGSDSNSTPLSSSVLSGEIWDFFEFVVRGTLTLRPSLEDIAGLTVFGVHLVKYCLDKPQSKVSPFLVQGSRRLCFLEGLLFAFSSLWHRS